MNEKIESPQGFWRLCRGFATALGQSAVLLSFLVWFSSGPANAAVLQRVPGQILVKPSGRIPEAGLQALFASHGAQQQRVLLQIDVRVLRVPEERLASVLDALNRNPHIEFAELDWMLPPDAVPNDTYYSIAWHLPKISAPAAWDITTGSGNVIVAILDSGVDGAHPDLAPQLVPGWNFYDNNSDTSDVTGHGTAVAGQGAAASNNGIGVASPAWGCKVMPLRVTDANGYASVSMIAEGVSYAADHGARVANVSFQATGSETLSSAAQYFQSKGGVVTVSAGNQGVFDGAADDPYVITVSATSSSDAIASFSNTGNNIDLSAPGVSIVTTTRGGGYGYGTGTSASAPIVAGIAALVISANPSLSGSQVQVILKQSADDLGPAGWDSSYGWGRANAYRAVAAALGTPPDTGPPPDRTAPSVQITSPLNGATISGTSVKVDVSASDNVAVTKVNLCVDGKLYASSSVASAAFTWYTSKLSPGSHFLQAVAYDAAGNSTRSVAVTVYK